MKNNVALSVILTLWLVSASPVWGQVTLGPAGPVPPAEAVAQAQKQPGPRRQNLLLQGAAEPSPALKYSFRVRGYDRQPGNAVPYYYRAFAMMTAARGDATRELQDLVEHPYAELVAAGVGDQLARFDAMFQQLEVAIHRTDCDWDWQIEHLEGTRTLEFLIPEIQEARAIARILAVKARWHTGRGEFDEAITALRLGYCMAQDVNRSPTLINSLVGIAIASMMNHEVAELIQAPDSPNLYWALAELPRPLISVRDAMELEANWPTRIFPAIAKAETEEMSADQWRAALKEIAQQFSRLNAISGDGSGISADAAEWMITGLITKGYARARQRLLERGFAAHELDAMPAARVVAIYQSRLSREIADELFKWQLVPPHLAWQFDRQTESRLQSAFNRGQSEEVLPIMRLLLPAIDSVRKAEARGWAELNVLQTLEAIRLHLAQHDAFPSRLADITAVPVPVNPITNELFTYHVQGDSATLMLDWPPEFGQPQDRGWWKFELTRREAGSAK